MSKYEELKDLIEREFAWAKEMVEEGDNPFDRGMLFTYERVLSAIHQLDEEP